MRSDLRGVAAGTASEELNLLESRCIAVREKIRAFASPWFVEFAGIPRAGKSGCIDIVDHFLQRNGFSVLSPSEGASRIPEFIKDSEDLIAYNAWTATYAIREILEGLYFKGPYKYDVVLLDRGLFDATAWFHYLEDAGKLTEEERKFMTKFVRVDHWRSAVKQVFLFRCTVEVSQEREFKDKLTEKHGATTRTSFLNDLLRVYESAESCYGDEFTIFRIQTDSTDPKRVASEVLQRMFDAVESIST